MATLARYGRNRTPDKSSQTSWPWQPFLIVVATQVGVRLYSTKTLGVRTLLALFLKKNNNQLSHCLSGGY